MYLKLMQGWYFTNCCTLFAKWHTINTTSSVKVLCLLVRINMQGLHMPVESVKRHDQNSYKKVTVLSLYNISFPILPIHDVLQKHWGRSVNDSQICFSVLLMRALKYCVLILHTILCVISLIPTQTIYPNIRSTLAKWKMANVR